MSLDFLKVTARSDKKGNNYEVIPTFLTYPRSKDLMIRGKDFYAIWVEDLGMWSTDEDVALELIDREIERYVAGHREEIGNHPYIRYMRDAATGSIDAFHKFCQKQLRDTYHPLDEELIFSNSTIKRENYASKKLPYALESGSISSWDQLIGTLYTPEERHKIEWAIGCIVSGDSKKIQKFLVLYGAAGTGKSTILNIIEKMFEGYTCTFEAKALGQSTNQYALEPFKNNPLVAIQHDGDLSRIEDNTRLNSLVSHENMSVNNKYQGLYEMRFKCFLLMGTNRPVKITDAKSGILRRLIDVTPSGNKIAKREYNNLMKQVMFELGAIAQHCLDVYKEDPGYYDDYVPLSMMGASNDFYNFVCDSYSVFKKEDGTTLKAAWEMYKEYIDEARVAYPLTKMIFKEELKNYFHDYVDSTISEDGTKLRSYYSGFRTDKFETADTKREKAKNEKKEDNPPCYIIDFQEGIKSAFDILCADCFAQYASSKETPMKKWEEVTSKLCELDTSKLHYAKIPENHIVIDFDLKDENGNISFEKNLAAASKWPKTYAELSKSGGGIHLHYIYTGNANELSRIYDENIEIKVFNGGSSLRRKLSKCNDLPIATISSGLPLKEGDKKLINRDGLKNERMIRNLIERHLNKEIMGSTAPSVQMIYKILNEAYESGVCYDVSDMRNAIYSFAMSSTNQSDKCIKLVGQMKFKSEEASETQADEGCDELVFYDIEVFPNLFLVNWKIAGEGKPIVRMINPKPAEIEELIRHKLVGFNNRDYDNHMIYACMMGYTNEQLYNLSQRLINSPKNEKMKHRFSEAYNLSYTDIYDFASAGNKKSLKKLEIEMRAAANDPESKMDDYTRKSCSTIKHKELGLPWDQPVPEELWERVAEYCDNDVISTEAAFHYLKGDWTARLILADISGLKPNDTTNTLSQKIIFGNNKNPQNEFNYRNLAEPVGSDQYEEYRKKFGDNYRFRVFNADGLPEYRDYIPGEKLPKGWSILPFFPGYKFEFGKSTYLGIAVGEGGRVYSEPGMYGGVWDGDITGMHPSSIIAEVLFGPRYTKAFKDIVDGRVSIKHKSWDDIDDLFDGKLRPYIQLVENGELTTKELADALKTVVNSVYGLTSAGFKNACRDPRNKDNIVAKRGALFMTLLTREVQKRGFTVCHNKTDSIKIPDATQEIQDFVCRFGKEYGYSFETEAEFEKFCLVNDAVYIAKTKDGEWTATGKQFAVPYVFKTLFSGKKITKDDLCETFAVSKGTLYLDMNETLPDVSELEKELEKAELKYKQGKMSDTTIDDIRRDLEPEIEKGHNYQFVGRVGQFTPVKPGNGGGVLYRMQDNKYYAAPGSTGYRWMESELVRDLPEFYDILDRSFYDKLVDDAIETIEQYGDFEWFVSDDPYISAIQPPSPDFMNIPETDKEELPFPEYCEKMGFA